jgi:hypothetical protein
MSTATTRPARHRLGTRTAWLAVLGTLAALSLAAMLPLTLLAGQLGNGLVAVVIGIPCAGVGLVVARRQPVNPLGWLFLVIAICLFLATDGGDYAQLVYRLGHHLPLGPVGLALDQAWSEGLTLFFVVILLFPDGRLASPFWRWALRAYWVLYAGLVATLAAATAAGLAAPRVAVDVTGGLSAVDNPSGWAVLAERPLYLALLVLSLGFIGRQLLSWRRSSGERRQQLKWLACGATVTVISAVLAIVFSTSGHSPALLAVLDILAWCGLAALPVSIGVGILKYRLYDIDRIVSRTLAYTVVTGLLVGVYAGLVLLATRVLPFSGSVAVAGSTLAAAALFNPLRRRVQRAVDRRFNRARYNADQMIAAFAARLQDATDLDGVRADLLGTARQALEPAHASLWLGGGRS